MSLSNVQKRFLGKCRKDPKPLLDMLHDCSVGLGTFLIWRNDPEFSGAFRRATAGITDDMLAELRLAFAVSGRLVATDIFATALKRNSKKRRGTKTQERQDALQNMKPLEKDDHNRCIDILKLGMTAFVPKTLPRKKRKPFPKPHPEAYARLRKAQGL